MAGLGHAALGGFDVDAVQVDERHGEVREDRTLVIAHTELLGRRDGGLCDGQGIGGMPLPGLDGRLTPQV